MNLLALLSFIVVAFTAHAQPAPPDFGFEFVTVGAPGNAAYVGNRFEDDFYLTGRGAVAYEYRISKTEIRTSDWLEFANTAREFQVPLDTSFGAKIWGAYLGIDRKTGREMYFQLSEESGDWPVAGISWWAAATYCNWLHNGKALNQEAFVSGAYDISTFGRDPVTLDYTDQTTHSPGARFWIPTTDEWLKAAHYDPNRYGQGEGGWWEYPDGSDTKPVSGIPGAGETSADLFDQIGFDAWETPVGSYPGTQSPWGLLDVSGGAAEWMEDWLYPNEPLDRLTDGSSIRTGGSPELDPDRVGRGYVPNTPDRLNRTAGLRLAAAVPAPGSVPVGLGAMWFGLRRKRI